jgi:hypothetical protein
MVSAVSRKGQRYSSSVISVTTLPPPTAAFTISTSSSPIAGGSTSGGGSYPSGATVTVTATANSCYTFSNWTEGGTVVSASPSYTFAASANRTLVANFTQINYTISTSSSPAAGGSTSGGGTKTCGASVTVTATANSGYSFVNWTEGATVVSASASYSFTASANRTLVANFGCTYSISPTSASVSDLGGTGTISVAAGSGCAWTATSNAGWITITAGAGGTGNGTVSYTVAANNSTNSLTGTITVAGQTFTVNQVADPKVTTSSSPTAGGTTTGGGNYHTGATVTVTATANSGYVFVNWTVSGTVVSTSASYTFTVTGPTALVANFSTVASYTITTSASPSTYGTTTGGGTYTNGSSVTVRATANAGYLFLNWTESSTVVSSSSNYTFTASANRTLVANFVADPVITTSSSPAAGGSTTGGGMYLPGATVTVTATANAGYKFVNWTVGSTVMSTSASYSFSATTNLNLVANFGCTYSISPTTANYGTAGGSSSVSVTAGSTCPWTATSSATSWLTCSPASGTGNGSVSYTVAANTGSARTGTLSLDGQTFTVTQSGVSAGPFTITTSSSPTAGGSTTGGGSYASGSSVTVNATANSGYTFSNWTEGGTVVSTTASYTFTASANRTLVANFAVSTVTPGSTLWAKSFGSGSGFGYSVARDASGNVFVAGYFGTAVDFGGGSLTSAGGQDIFVAKYSPSGTYIWAKQFGGTGDDAANNIAVDSSGNVFVTGYFSATASFGTNSYTSFSGKDAFLAKLSGSSGAVVWSRRIGSSYTLINPPDDIGLGVAVDPTSGAVVIAGQIVGWADFGDGNINYNVVYQSPFLAKYDMNGAPVWHKTFGANTGFAKECVAVDAGGNVFAAGNLTTTVDLGNGVLPYIAMPPATDFYVAKFTPSGSNVWGRTLGTTDGSLGAFVAGIALDASANVFLTGGFSGKVDLGSGVSILGSATLNSAYLVKLAGSNGGALWAAAFTNISVQSASFGNSVTVDTLGNPAAVGSYYNTIGVGGTTLTSASANVWDVFAVKYSAAGSLTWAKSFGGAASDQGYGVTADQNNNVVVTGYTGGGNFGGTNLTVPVGSTAPFLMKLAP